MASAAEADSRGNLRKALVVFLVIIFGTGSWVAVNGLWVELPLLVVLGIPEGYNLASYLTIIIQIANIGPLVFTVATYLKRDAHLEVPAVYIILPIGVISCLLLVFLWDLTTYVGGVLRSVPLLCLSFFISIVDCTSSVAFTPFMSRFKSTYVTWYFVGEGFSALLPSLVALGQGVGSEVCVANYTYMNTTTGQNCTAWMGVTEPANFPPSDFFWFLFAMMLCSLIAFILLNTLPLVKKEHSIETLINTPASGSQKSSSSSECMSLTTSGRYVQKDPNEPEKKEPDEPETPAEVPDHAVTDELIAQKTRKSTASYVYLYLLLAYVCAMSNGVLPSIQSYSCGPYSFNAYLLAATLGNVANPVACFVVMLFPQRSLILVGATSFCGTLMAIYCLATAALSPTPPLQDEMAGAVLVVLAWVLVSGLFTYSKATIGWILRNEPNNRRLLIGFGGVTQLGSLVGACIMFPLVNVLALFTPYYGSPCDGYAACQS